MFINNKNNVLIYNWPAMMSTYMDFMRRSLSLCGKWKVPMASVMASNYTMFEFNLAVFSLLINFVVNMMYLQIIYQCEALQMPKMIKQEVLQLACIWLHLYISYGVLINYLQQLLCISQEQSDLYMLVTSVKGLTCSNYKVKVNINIA